MLRVGPATPSLPLTVAYWHRPLPVLQRLHRLCGPRFTLDLIDQRFAVFTDPDDAREILTADPDAARPGEGTELLGHVIGPDALPRLDGARHLAERRMVLPCFRGERLQAMRATMEEAAAATIARWPGGTVATVPLFEALSYTLVMRTIIGLDADDPRMPEVRGRVRALLDAAGRLPNLLPSTQRTIAGRGPWAGFQRARAGALGAFGALIEQRRGDAAGRSDLLSTLLTVRDEDGRGLRDEQVVDHLTTMILGGHESISLTLGWACLLLAHHPEAQDRLVAALDAGADGGRAHLDATIQETLRRRPSLPLFPRRLARAVAIAGREFPAGTRLHVNAYLLHHAPSVHPEPYAFRPERFLERPPGTYTWLPYGGGRRRCIGAAFAHQEMTIVLAALLRCWRIAPAARRLEATRHVGAVWGPERGARVVLAPRQASATTPRLRPGIVTEPSSFVKGAQIASMASRNL
jgi:cytochrome P450 family 135